MRDAREMMASVNALLNPDNRKRISTTLASLERISANLDAASARMPAVVARTESWLSVENRRLATGALERMNETMQSMPELARETQQLVKDARDLVGQVGRLSAEAHSATGAVRDDTLPRVNALAESVERGAQRVGRLALQLDRDPQSAIFGRKPGRPGPGEKGFQQ